MPSKEIKDFDDLQSLLQNVEKSTQVYLREGRRVEPRVGTDCDRLEEMINRVRRQEES